MICLENLGPGARQKCRARTEANCCPLRPLQAPCDVLRVMKHGSPQPSSLKGYKRVQTCLFSGLDQPLEHNVLDDSDDDTIPSTSESIVSSRHALAYHTATIWIFHRFLILAMSFTTRDLVLALWECRSAPTSEVLLCGRTSWSSCWCQCHHQLQWRHAAESRSRVQLRFALVLPQDESRANSKMLLLTCISVDTLQCLLRLVRSQHQRRVTKETILSLSTTADPPALTSRTSLSSSAPPFTSSWSQRAW